MNTPTLDPYKTKMTDIYSNFTSDTNQDAVNKFHL